MILKKARELGRATILLTNESSAFSASLVLREKIQSVMTKHALLAKAVADSSFINYEIESIFENFFIVDTTISEIIHSIKKKDIKKFPLVASVASKRIGKTIRLYALFEAFLSETYNKVDRGTLLAFLEEYQKGSPLSIRELNAVPVLLRLILVENFGVLINSALKEVQEFNDADRAYMIVKKGMAANAGDPSHAISMLASKYPLVPITFGTHLLERLSQEGSSMRPIIRWIRLNLEKQGMGIDQISEISERQHSMRSFIISNIVESLHWLNQVRWDSIAESINVVDSVLSKDPANVFSSLEMESKDLYRNVVVQIAERVSIGEAEVARVVLRLAGRAKGIQRHVGYYLLDPVGRSVLEREVKYTPSRAEQIYRTIIANPQKTYFGLTALFSVLLLVGFLITIDAFHATPIIFILWLIIGVALALEAGIIVVNVILTQFLPVKKLPRIKLEDDVGLDRRTCVVVPSMLRSEKSIKEIVEKFEVRYLGNNEKNIYYALLFDFKDAEREVMESDQRLLECLAEEIKRLNILYGSGETKFFGLTRRRLWNEKEGVFMGWERKRGKLREFNQLLRGRKDTSYLDSQNIASIGHVQYVITLDEDTEMPQDTARKLIGTISHPLNAPILSKEGVVERGYGIIQPRVSVRLEVAARSLYSKLYSAGAGIDSYSGPVSDVYQDLFGNALFFGKGIYDIDAVELSMAAKIPDNTVLSHDLLEGIYARTGLASDAVLFDGFPDFYHEFIIRLERWIRGDWQIVSWLFSGREQFSAIDRFKIFDNLRRSTVPVAVMAGLILGFFTQNSFAYISIDIIGLLMFSHLLSFLISLAREHAMPFKLRLAKIVKDLWLVCLRTLLKMFFVFQQAWVSMHAIGITIVRLFITKKKLLLWQSSYDIGRMLRGSFLEYYSLFSISVILSFSTLLYLKYLGKLAGWYLFWAVIWCLAPAVAAFISRPRKVAPALTEREKIFVRKESYRSALYFLENADRSTNWLVPDHVQEFPILSGEARITTSPTNMGMHVVALISAFDLGYISPLLLRDRTEKLFASLSRLSLYKGHFMNWYDISTLQPILPQYVSSVDSANFLLALLTAERAYVEMAERPVISPESIKGLIDTVSVFVEEAGRFEQTAERQLRKNIREIVGSCRALLAATNVPGADATTQQYAKIFSVFYQHISLVLQKVQAIAADDPQSLSNRLLTAVERMEAGIYDQKYSLERLSPDIPVHDVVVDMAKAGSKEVVDMMRKIEKLNSTIQTFEYIAQSKLSLVRNLGFEQAVNTSDLSADSKTALLSWYRQVLENVERSAAAAKSTIDSFNALAASCAKYVAETDFKFLYNKEKELFHIGYNVAFNKTDNACYNFMASEANSISFMAILKRDVPQKHWFYLGRRMVRSGSLVSLISWGGSLFEYLTSFIFFKVHDESLLGNTARAAIKVHFEHAKKNKALWGMGESAYYQFDESKHYQYQIFGSPKLGLKRNLNDFLVVAPYTSALAMKFFPHKAVRNLKAIIKQGGHSRYGFYDALDYMSNDKRRLKKPLPTKTYYAHHQGFTLASFVNVLMDNRIQKLFHSHPSVRALDVLFEEKMPEAPIAEELSAPVPVSFGNISRIRDTGLESKRFIPLRSAAGRYAFISKNDYSVRVGSDGSSTSFYKRIALSRPSIDPVYEYQGMFLYIRDKKTKSVYSLVPRNTEHHRRHKVIFYENKVEFLASHPSLDTSMSIAVDSESPVEVRECTLHNTGLLPLSLDLTFYSEMSLSYAQQVFHHPYYEHLLVRGEILPHDHGVLFYRPHPADKSKMLYCAQLLISKELSKKQVSLSTSREDALARFAEYPAANLANDNKKIGVPLDPASCIASTLDIPAGGEVSLVWVQLASESRVELDRLIRRYKHFSRAHNVTTQAISQSATSTRAQGITQEQSVMFQEVASQVLVGSMSTEEFQKSEPGPVVHSLWRMGISGDRPIALFIIHDIKDMQTAKQALQCFEYFQSKGVVVDVVILNNQPASYIKVLDDEVDFLIRQAKGGESKEGSGSLYQVKSDLISAGDREVLLYIARFVMDSKTETLREAIDKNYKAARQSKAQKFVPILKSRGRSYTMRTSVATPSLSFYNSYGGFDPNTNEYVMTISSDRMPPFTWTHVIAQPDFGTIIADSGSAYTWSMDSYDNRLTARTADALRYRSSEVIYLRDDETGEVWNPTPFPIETKQPFLVRYGFGYASYESTYSGIHQVLKTFVPQDETVKVSLLSLKNNSHKDRHITLYYYLEPSMAALRDHTTDHLSFTFDEGRRSMLFANEFRNQLAGRTAFASFGNTPGEIGWTTDKREFIGRFGSYHFPSAVRKEKLSNSISHGSENCIALSLKIVIPAGEQVTVPILLGDAVSRFEAMEKIESLNGNINFEIALEKVKEFWKQKLGVVPMRTGDQSIDLLMNGWLLYQALASRLYAKSGAYQPSGAYGFRDQLQDVSALIWSDPALVRGFILKAAAHQFKEGDALNWWHDHNKFGIRTVLSDHQLWLAYTLFEYVKVTGDKTIFAEEVGFIEAQILSFTDRKQWTGVPSDSLEKASVFEHAMRAIEKSLVFGPHGLPLMGLSDWNDGLSNVGSGGKGESVWVAWFLLRLLNIALPLLRERGEEERLKKFTAACFTIEQAIQKSAWDGKWYRRAYFDNGTPLGSKFLKEFKIDSVAQSWAVLSGAGDREKSIIAHRSMTKNLLHDKYFALISPALQDGYVKPGYIQDYPAGIRENGAQYNHATLWTVQSYAQLGENEMAEKILSFVNPILRSNTKEKANDYKIEPYVVASDVYGGALAGRGGWSWYTGSAGVMYRTIFETILGINRRGDLLSVTPQLLKSMNNVKVTLPCGASKYHLIIKRSGGRSYSKISSATRDDQKCDVLAIPFVDDGKEHEIIVTLG